MLQALYPQCKVGCCPAQTCKDSEQDEQDCFASDSLT